MDEPEAKNRKQRRAEAAQGRMDTNAFLKMADKFIDVANRENTNTKATELHMAFLYAAARYNAYVGKTIMDIEDHEKFVGEMTAQYTDMLRQHLADPSVG